MKEGQTFVDILNPVDSHLAAVGFPQLLAGDDLQQLQQLPPVPQVCEQILHLVQAVIREIYRKRGTERERKRE